MIGLCIGVNGLVCRAQHSPYQLFTNNARNTGCYCSWFVLHVQRNVLFRVKHKPLLRAIYIFKTKEVA